MEGNEMLITLIVLLSVYILWSIVLTRNNRNLKIELLASDIVHVAMNKLIGKLNKEIPEVRLKLADASISLGLVKDEIAELKETLQNNAKLNAQLIATNYKLRADLDSTITERDSYYQETVNLKGELKAKNAELKKELGRE